MKPRASHGSGQVAPPFMTIQSGHRVKNTNSGQKSKQTPRHMILFEPKTFMKNGVGGSSKPISEKSTQKSGKKQQAKKKSASTFKRPKGHPIFDTAAQINNRP